MTRGQKQDRLGGGDRGTFWAGTNLGRLGLGLARPSPEMAGGESELRTGWARGQPLTCTGQPPVAGVLQGGGLSFVLGVSGSPWGSSTGCRDLLSL